MTIHCSLHNGSSHLNRRLRLFCGFVAIQFPLFAGRGGKCIYPTSSGKFPDEISDNFKFSKRGVVAMANSGPNTNGRHVACRPPREALHISPLSIFVEVTGAASQSISQSSAAHIRMVLLCSQFFVSYAKAPHLNGALRGSEPLCLAAQTLHVPLITYSASSDACACDPVCVQVSTLSWGRSLMGKTHSTRWKRFL